MNDYLEYSLYQQDSVLALTSMSKDDFVKYWSKQVSEKFNLNYDTILGLYDRKNDKYNTETSTRAIWKYGAAKGVSGTPTAFINGVKLDAFPDSTEAWLDTIKEVYYSQWGEHPLWPASVEKDMFLQWDSLSLHQTNLSVKF